MFMHQHSVVGEANHNNYFTKQQPFHNPCVNSRTLLIVNDTLFDAITIFDMLFQRGFACVFQHFFVSKVFTFSKLLMLRLYDRQILQ